MADTFEQFDRKVRAFAKRIEPELIVPFHKKLVFEALTRLVQKTPVDTGRARANWQVTIGRAAKGVVQDTDAQSNLGGGSKTTDKGIAALSALKPHQVVFITNNVPYIRRLEDGHSKQAPQGMLRLTVQEMLGMFS